MLIQLRAVDARFKDGVPLTASDRVKFLTPDDQTHILILNRTEESDLGVYECRAANKVGSLSSKAQLVITGKNNLIFKIIIIILFYFD